MPDPITPPSAKDSPDTTSNGLTETPTRDELLSILEKNEQFYHKIRSSLPGNIVKSHGRNHTCLMFWKFPDSVDRQIEILAYIGRLATDGVITSARQQESDTNLFKERGVQRLFMGLYLTESGLEYFNWPKKNEQLKELHFDHEFPEGDFIDPDYRNSIDGLLLLAHDAKTVLDNQVRYYRQKLGSMGARIKSSEWGQVLKNNNGQSIEPFGYPDGISQPVFLHRAKHKLPDWNMITDLEKVLVDEKLKTSVREKSYGSYLTFMKLDQDVRRFREMEKEVEKQLLTSGEESILYRVGEMAMGRDLNGNPLADKEDKKLSSQNDFDFSSDQKGTKCPFHAHIRKMNPRRKSGRLNMVRRGVPYGFSQIAYPDRDAINQLPARDAGLLFLSFQKNFKSFKEIWNRRHKTANVGADPIIGNVTDVMSDMDVHVQFRHKYPVETPAGITQKEVTGFDSLVKLKGALQFFAPSLALFKHSGAEAKTKKDPQSPHHKKDPIMKPYPLFGKSKNSFTQSLIKYNAIKASIDSQGLAYDYTNETHGPGNPPPNIQGYLDKYLEGIREDEELVFEYFYPVRKGDTYSISTQLIDWETNNVVANHFNDLDTNGADPRTTDYLQFKAAYQATDPATDQTETKVQFDNPNDNHGYCRILLAGVNAPLNEILTEELQRTTEKRYIIRIKSRVRPYDDKNAEYLREDSIIFRVTPSP